MVKHFPLEEPVQGYWVYHNLTTFFASIIFAVFLFQTDIFRDFMSTLGQFGFLGAFFIGIFFVSAFTVAPATAGLIVLAESLNIFGIALFAGIGAALGDYLIFRFVRDGLATDLRRLFAGVGSKKIFKIFHSRFFGALTPVLGALIIASPLPDEFGIGLLGLTDVDNKRFFVVSFLLNVLGVLALLGAINAFR